MTQLHSITTGINYYVPREVNVIEFSCLRLSIPRCVEIEIKHLGEHTYIHLEYEGAYTDAFVAELTDIIAGILD